MKNFLLENIDRKSLNEISRTKKITNEIIEEILEEKGFSREDAKSMDRAAKLNALKHWKIHKEIKIFKNIDARGGFSTFEFSTLSKYIKQLCNFNNVTKSKTLESKVDEYLKSIDFDSAGLSIIDKLYVIKNDILIRPTCKHCGKITNRNGESFREYCCNECAQKSEETKAKIRNAFLEKYGVENILSLEDTREKITITNIEKYGVDVAAKSAIVKEKTRNTCFEKYGVSSVAESLIIKQKIRNKQLDIQYEKLLKLKHIEPNFSREEYSGTRLGIESKIYSWKCKECGNIFDHKYYFSGPNSIQCPKCKPKGSNIELIIENFLKKYKIEYVARSYSILENKQQLDFYIPSRNLGIEVNGLYWHCELNNNDPKYHVDKLESCLKQGISLVNIFADDLEFKRCSVLNRLKQKLGLLKYSIRASKCDIREIDFSLAEKFLNKYHIQGSCQSTIRIGLFYKDKLVSLMTFGKNRFGEGAELLRFCSIANFKIHGAYSKFMKFYIENFKPEILTTYADRNWGEGNTYLTPIKTIIGECSFAKDSQSIGFSYTDLNRRFNRMKFQRKNLKSMLGIDNIESDMKTSDIINKNGFFKIFDCGNNRYSLNIDNGNHK